MSNTQPTACILCSRNCGLTVELDDRQLRKIKGDPAHPLTQGYICQKAARLDFYQNTPDRLEQPLKRLPDGSFRPITWDQALSEIASQLNAIKAQHGGDAFAFCGGGGQGNHLGGAYARQITAAMGSKFTYNSLAQEKTGDFWLNGRLFGRQSCHTTEDVEHSDYVLFVGCNPYQAHGIPNARDTLKHLHKDPTRTVVVIDPRRSETADVADIHLQLKPGTDAFLLAAILAVIVQEDWVDHAFLSQHTQGYEQVRAVFNAISVAEFAQQADIAEAQVRAVAQGFAKAKRGCIRVDLGIQHSLNTTLNGYLEKLLFLLCGHFGKPGVNNLHTMMLPILGHTDERRVIAGNPLKRTAYHGMMPISGLYPPAILPDEILLAGDKRVRAVMVDSANPLLTWPNTQGYEQAFAQLDLLVVVDVAMTETARLAHYVLPAASQFEKWECTGFNLEFPANAFHLRKPLLTPYAQSLPEAEIYTRLLEKMGVIKPNYPVLSRIARTEPAASKHAAYLAALGVMLARQRKLLPYAASILYRTLGPHLRTAGGAVPSTAAFLLPLSLDYARRYHKAVVRAGHAGNVFTAGVALFKAILNGHSGTLISRHEYSEMWQLMGHKHRQVTLAIPEMLQALQQLKPLEVDKTAFPYVLMAGERRAYNANQIFRHPQWRKVDAHGFLRMHPDDAAREALTDGQWVEVISGHGAVQAPVQLDDSVRPGMLTLPHGYGQINAGQTQRQGPALNLLVASDWCEPLSRTPYHKHVPVRVQPLKSVQPAADQLTA